MPKTSDRVFPNAAAAMVLMTRLAPRNVSIDSPATIMMKLSRNPKPTNGRPCWIARRYKSEFVGRIATPTAAVVAPAFVDVVVDFFSSDIFFCNATMTYSRSSTDKALTHLTADDGLILFLMLNWLLIERSKVSRNADWSAVCSKATILRNFRLTTRVEDILNRM